MRQFTRKAFPLIRVFNNLSHFQFAPPQVVRHFSKKPSIDDEIPDVQIHGVYEDISEIPPDELPYGFTPPTSKQKPPQLNVIQTQLDRLAKQQDELTKKVNLLDAKLEILSSSIQMLAESHVNQRVPIMLRTMNLVYDTKIPFQRVNNEQRLQDFLIIFVQNLGVRGAEDAIKKSLPKQYYVELDGVPIAYTKGCLNASNWITGPLNVSRGGRNRSMLSGEVSMVGSITSISRGLHRAMRFPVLMKRFTQRVYKALNKCSPEESIHGMEKTTIFLITSLVQAEEIPIKYLNRVLTPNDIAQLEQEILDPLPGEVFIPSDEKLIEYIVSDPLQDPIGIWRIFMESEWNERPIAKLKGAEKDVFALLLLLRMMCLFKFDLYIGTCLNQL